MIQRFRAWHKKEKKMYNVKSIEWLVMTDGTHKIDNLHLVKINYPDKCGLHCRLDEVILIKSIGRHDTNGKELFKHDIIRHKNGRLYMIDYSDINFWWFLAPLKQVYNAIKGQDMRLHMCERIGNSYKNPELLKEDD